MAGIVISSVFSANFTRAQSGTSGGAAGALSGGGGGGGSISGGSRSVGGTTGLLGTVPVGGQFPSPQYYQGLELYRAGDLERAIDFFEIASRDTRIDFKGRWIDSIPALAMLAECHWQLGDLETARGLIDRAFSIAIVHRGWLGRSNLTSILQNQTIRSKPPWLWDEAAAINVLPTSQRVAFQAGDLITEARLAQGGVIEERNIRVIDLVEVMRTLSVAAHRRRIIMGQLSKDDSLVSDMVNAIKFPAQLNDPTARSLIGTMRVAGYFSRIDQKRVESEIKRSTSLVNGVHPITPIALHCAAWSASDDQQPAQVVELALRTANVAAATEQPEWIGEAMQLAAGFADPTTAVAVAKRAGLAANATNRQSRLASLHCLIAAADASVTAGDLTSAKEFLNLATSLSARRDVALPRINTYGSYVAARLAAASGESIGSGNATDADRSLGRISQFAFQQRSRRRRLVSMPSQYQLGLVQQSVGSASGGTTGDALLRFYSQDAPLSRWRRDPVDALAVSLADRSAVRAARVNLAAAQEYPEPLLAAADELLAGRFLDRLPLGGRLANVRTLAAADDRQLAPGDIEARNAAGPAMNELRAGLSRLAPTDDDLQLPLIESLEARAADLALRRLAFPDLSVPRINVDRLSSDLPERTGMLVFVLIDNQLHAVLATREKVTQWSLRGVNRLPSEVSRMLKGIGVGKNRGKRLPENDDWKKTAASIRARLFPDDQSITKDQFDQLVIVPDGPLWYLPFELLSLGDQDGPLMGDEIAIRYAPTPGIAMNPTGSLVSSSKIALVSSNLFAPRDQELNRSKVDGVLAAADESIELPGQSKVPSGLLDDQVGHLIVAAAQQPNVKDPLAASLAPHDGATPAGSLGAWLRFPASSPQNVITLGMRTPLDFGQIGDGQEIFLTLSALHASGVRGVLLSRWAVGGESTAILAREMAQELPFSGLNQSWNRAKAILQDAQLDPNAEPLLPRSEAQRESLSGGQPLFWSGYLLSSPEQPEPLPVAQAGAGP